ncbi:two-partner secretion domain-containing protein [Pseudomonas sp. RT6P73]
MTNPQYSSSSSKPMLKSVFPAALSLLAATMLQASMSTMAVADLLPSGGIVNQGSVSIGTVGNTMTIDQGSQNAVINWNSFDVAQGHAVHFQVPTGGATLNQIAGPASQINGNLSSTGALFLVNPNGVVFGKGSSVDVGSLVASTSAIDAKEFMNGSRTFTTGGTGMISNSGTITAGSGGYVVLAGAGTIENKGSITVPNGTIQMVSADKFMLTMPTENRFLQVTLDGTAKGGGRGP